MLVIKEGQSQELLQQTIREFSESPDSFITGLYDVERVIISIVGLAINPLSTNEIRRRFIGSLKRNIIDNIDLNFLGAVHILGQNNISKLMAVERVKKQRRFRESLDKAANVEKFLNDNFVASLGRKGKQIKRLIPSFETFSNYISDLDNMNGLGVLETREAPDERGKFVYYLNGRFSEMWNERRKELHAEISGMKDRGIDSSITDKELAFYGLINEAIGIQMEYFKKSGRFEIRKFTLTDLEDSFLSNNYLFFIEDLLNRNLQI